MMNKPSLEQHVFAMALALGLSAIALAVLGGIAGLIATTFLRWMGLA